MNLWTIVWPAAGFGSFADVQSWPVAQISELQAVGLTVAAGAPLVPADAAVAPTLDAAPLNAAKAGA